MKKYLFVLGNHPIISKAEIEAVFENLNVISFEGSLLAVEMPEIDCQKSIDRLGGAIKIAEIFDTKPSAKDIVDILFAKKEGKIVFGFSNYGRTEKQKNRKTMKQWNNEAMELGMEVKKIIKAQDRSVRFVTSKEPTLSSVIVTKNKCQEFIMFGDSEFAKTCAVQDFLAYGKRDFGRPTRDAKSGMLPPKIAQIMLNVSRVKKSDTLLDPFCGSGTILQEAMLMGIEKIIGSDASHNAVDDSRKNILWMSEELGTRRKESGIDIFQNNVENISDKVKDVNVIVTEPYLGPPLRGHETQDQILQITNQLGQLYAKTFEEFEKILKKDGRVVIIFPKFLVHAKSRRVDIDKKIETLGFLRLDDGRFTYKREGQRVQREIRIYRKA